MATMVRNSQGAYKPRSAGQDDDRPIGGRDRVQMGEQPFPARSPGAFGRDQYDVPRHRDGAAADDDPEGEDGEALSQRRVIHGQREWAATGAPSAATARNRR